MKLVVKNGTVVNPLVGKTEKTSIVIENGVVTEITKNGETTTTSDDTDFSKDHFFLLLAEPQVALAKEGTLITFDIDDVDGGTFAYNSDLKQITFNKMLRLSSGFPPRTMTLYGTFDVLELTNKLVLRQTQEVLIEKVTITYTFHRLVEQQE